MKVPFVDLAARVARFEAPFQYLKTVKATFDPYGRFMLNLAMVGDAAAIAAREEAIHGSLPLMLIDVPLDVLSRANKRFIGLYDSDISAFTNEQYPWLAMPEVVTKELPPSLDLLDDVIGMTMNEFGFHLQRRKKTKMEWRCTSSIAAVPITMSFDRGNWKMTGFLDIPDLPYHGAVGQPFFFSQVEFPHGDSLEPLVRSFFGEYAKFFPHVIETIERALPIRERFLAGDKEGAIELARSMAPKPTVPLGRLI